MRLDWVKKTVAFNVALFVLVVFIYGKKPVWHDKGIGDICNEVLDSHRYSLAVNAIGFGYSVLQGCDLVYQLATGTQFNKRHYLRYYFDFAMDQIEMFQLVRNRKRTPLAREKEKEQEQQHVRLLGCCNKGSQRILVYEYMKNRSLDLIIYVAAENLWGYLPVTDKKDGYSFIYPFGWQMIMLEGAKATTETVDALRTGAQAMKAMQKDVNIDDVDKTMDEINEQTENMKQIQEALSAPIGPVDFDEDELEAELEELEGAELEEQLLQPATTAPAAPVQVPGRIPMRPAPRKNTPEEDELAALQAEMAL